MTRRHAHTTLFLTAGLTLLGTASCSPDGGEANDASGTPAEEEARPQDFQGHVFERNVVFMTTREDSALVVPWLLTARTRPGVVDRRARGLFARSGEWEPFFDARWESPPTRVPWRILPHENMRLIVGDEEELERIVFEEGPRHLQVVLGSQLMEWTGQRGGTFRLQEGALLLANQRVPGLVIDMARTRRADALPPGDWLVLASGDSLQVVFHQPVARPPGTAASWRGWARLAFRSLQWSVLEVTGEETRAFEPARRDVPVRWSLAAEAGELAGSLEVGAAHLEAGEGDGPQLPVDALFQVEGTLRVEGGSYPVVGLFRHRQR